MTLPVSSYEELLVQVRELTHETILLQRQLSSDLLNNVPTPPDVNHNFAFLHDSHENGKLLGDNVIKRCERNRQTEIGPKTLGEYRNLRFRSRFCPSFEIADSIRSGDLTNRLLAWGRENNRFSTQVEEEAEDVEEERRPERVRSEERRSSRGSRVQQEVTVLGGGVGVGVGAEEIIPRGARRRRRQIGSEDHSRDRATPLAGQEVLTTEEEEEVDAAAGATGAAAATRNSVRLLVGGGGGGNGAASSPTTAAVRCARTAVKTAVRATDSSRSRVYLPIIAIDANKEDAMEPEVKEKDERSSSTPSPEFYMRRQKHYNEEGSSEEDNRVDIPLQSQRLPSSYRGTWPIRRDIWASQQMGYSTQQSTPTTVDSDMASVMSFSSHSGGTASGRALECSTEMRGQRSLGAKVDVVYNLLGMLGSTEGREDMSATLLSMSNSIDSCLVMRQSGCLPLLVQLIHAPGQDPQTRERASRALHNVVQAKSDERAGRREARVLRFLEQLRDYCQALRTSLETGRVPDDLERHPSPTITALMKLSFDEAHRHAMCQLGGLHAVAELIEMDHLAHGSECDDSNCITLRRYAGMALTNLTFGDGNNKALLCSFREFMKALVSQLRSPSDDLRQVTASVLRNLSWRADDSSKQTLREVGAVTGLMKAAMEGRKESALKSILSALWNLSAHCSTNKMDICAVDGALAFLVDMLSYKAPSKTLAIVENAGGILRNVSSYVAIREDYRTIVREKGCLQVLLQQLRSPSLTVVSNACGALWNLSARCPQDQKLLWDLGAVPMLRSLVHSKHKMISMGSSAALKNLLSARPGATNLVHLDSTARGLGLSTLPSLVARRQKALEQEIDQNLAETCDNIEPSTSPTNKDEKFAFKDHSFLGSNTRILRSYQLQCNQPGTSTGKSNGVPRSESRESMRSITSTHSDTMFERVNRHVLNGMSPSELQVKQQSSSLHSAVGFGGTTAADSHRKTNSSEKKYTLRYKNATTDRSRTSDVNTNEITELKCINSTISWSSAGDQESACSQMLLHSSVEDNLSLINRSFSSASKADSQSSISEEVEPTVCTKPEYQDGKSRPTKTSPISLIQHEQLSTIHKAVSPTMNHSTDGDFFTDYAQTDLDQPTDYSLRYAEQTVEDKHESAYFSSSDQVLLHEDTVKTYCTEGTPHETSLNSSRAPSTTDLQDDCRTRNLSKIVAGRNRLRDAKQCRQDTTIDIAGSRDCKPRQDLVTVDEGNKKALISKKYEENNSIPPVTSEAENLHESIEQVSDGDEDDEDLLAACINIGMQNNRHRHSFIGNSFEKLPRCEGSLTRYQTSVALDQVEFDSTIDSKNTTHRESMDDSKYEVDDPNKDNKISEKHIQSSMSLGQIYARTDTAVDSILKVELPNGTMQEDGGLTIPESNEKSTPDYSTFTKSKKKCSKLVKENDSANNECPTVLISDAFNGDIQDAVTEDSMTCENTSMKQSYVKITDSESNESFDSVEQSEHTLLKLCIQPGLGKNEDDTLKDAPSSLEFDRLQQQSESLSEEGSTELGKDVIDSKENLERSSPRKEKHLEEDVYRRQRDPDAMIASLDRLTATLVQQTEAMRERDSNLMKQSTLSDTWNETSPNDVTFPSISISAPLIVSFRSDVQEDQGTVVSDITEAEDHESMNMTESKIIEREAIKLANAVDAEAIDQQELEMTSMISMDLDAINPPSAMGSLVSLTTSYAGPVDTTELITNRDRCYSTSLPPLQNRPSNGRKKSLPVGVVAKRALGHAQNHTGSLENLLNECTNSHLDNVKPPSMMDEVLDVGDMENSMLSVASITSEVADQKDQDSNSLTSSDPVFDLLKPVANVLSMTCMRYAEAMHSSANNSLSECLENINPPSLFNEVSEMEESTIEAVTDTLCSDTLCADLELKTEEATRPTVADRIEEDNDTDEAVTPLSTEYCVSSSAESTPKKRLNKNYMTPKQKRNLAKERYKTYVIAAEIVKKEEERRKQDDTTEVEKIPRGKCSPFTKLTPKQRRQEDRARFQTQVLQNPFPDLLLASEKKKEEIPETVEKATTPQQAKSAIPMLKKGSACKESRKKRTENDENKDRYRTRTLNDLESILGDDRHAQNNFTNGEVDEDTRREDQSEEIRSMLEQNATIVLRTLNESSKVTNHGTEEFLLDCETISLVSNESEPERHLKMRMVNGLPLKPMNATAPQSSNESPVEACKTPYEASEYLQNGEQYKAEESGDSQSEEEANCVEEQPQEMKRPRIIKPGMGSRDQSIDSNGSDPENPKAIRGKRKALYSNPITRKSTPQTSPFKQAHPVSAIPIGRSNTSPIVRATRATTLRQNTKSPNTASKDSTKLQTSPKITPSLGDSEKKARNAAIAAKRISVPQKGCSLTFTKSTKRHSTPGNCSANVQNEIKSDIPCIKPLERQGTFTKDEPEMENPPTVLSATSSPIKTKIAKPVRNTSPKSQTIAKAKTTLRTQHTNLSKIGRANSTDKIQPPKNLSLLVTNKKTATSKTMGIAKQPPGSQVLLPNETGRTFRKGGALGQRSNSNSSIVFNSSAGGQNRKLAKEATSKIASLWKKVEESKSKQKLVKPDTRQWITPKNGAKEIDSTDDPNASSFRLFRSSTFEGISQNDVCNAEIIPEVVSTEKIRSKRPPIPTVHSNGVKYRNSCDLSGMSANEAPCKIPVKSSDEAKREIDDSPVVLRRQQSTDKSTDVDPTKRVSRLGSFIRVDPSDPDEQQIRINNNGIRAPASAIVPPFNYHPKQEILSHVAKAKPHDVDGKPGALEYPTETITASAKVTTV